MTSLFITLNDRWYSKLVSSPFCAPILILFLLSSPLLSSLYLGALLLELSGHRDLVTSIEMRSIPIGAAGEETPHTRTGEVATDMIVSVSDDHTARVFYFTGQSLLT